MTGQVNFECTSLGFPIPADTQLTNPQQITRRNFNGTQEAGVVDQPEPDGLYSSKATTGTWVLCIRPDGQIAPHYTEDEVSTWPYAVTIDDNGMAHDAGGETTVVVNVTSGSTGTAPPSTKP
jgi:hypothetical protein